MLNMQGFQHFSKTRILYIQLSATGMHSGERARLIGVWKFDAICRLDVGAPGVLEMT